MTKIAICDDNVELCGYLKELLTEEFAQNVSVSIYNNIKEMLVDYESGKERNVADILLMDIEVDGVNGIDVVEELQRRYGGLKVIFITGYVDYSTEIFRVNPSNFLIKPIEKDKLREAVIKAICELEEEDKDCFVVTSKGNVFKLRARDILYFESEKRTVILHSRYDSWTIYRKLDEVQKELPDYFLRCHQSYLVNMNEIKSLKPLKVELYEGEEVPISRPKYKEAKERFLNFIGQF